MIISTQENRSFDHYFGFAPQVQAAGLGAAAGLHATGRRGRAHAPFELTALRSPDPPHRWDAVHAQYNDGHMDGFYTAAEHDNGDGNNAILYYTARAAVLLQPLPRLGAVRELLLLAARPDVAEPLLSDGGNVGRDHDERAVGLRVFDSSSWPIILDLLDDAGVSWKIYYIGFDSVENGDTDNVAVFWSRWAHDPRTTATFDDYLDDCRNGTLPSVSWIISSFSMQFDEHPDADVGVGMGFQQQAINALRRHGCGTGPPSCSPTTSTAASSITSRRRRSTRSASGFASRSGSSPRSHGAGRSSRASRPTTSRR